MLQKANVDASRSRQTLEEQMVAFEKKKMEDIKVMSRDSRINKILSTHVHFFFHRKYLGTFFTPRCCSTLKPWKSTLKPAIT